MKNREKDPAGQSKDSISEASFPWEATQKFAGWISHSPAFHELNSGKGKVDVSDPEGAGEQVFSQIMSNTGVR